MNKGLPEYFPLQRYNISVEDEELVQENLDSVANVARFVETKLNTAGCEA